MTMEFYFDDKKCEETGYLKENCLNAIRRYLQERNKNGTIKETSEGVFVGTFDDIKTFCQLSFLADVSWFKSTISKWTWSVPEMDGYEYQYDMISGAKKHGLW
ncbi:MAG TPA: hypothetical protein PLS28_01815 [Clostridiales bacterium]|nr:hypothetical protein [Clostridiales bacterium]